MTISRADSAEIIALATSAKTLKTAHSLADSLGEDSGSFVHGFKQGLSDCWEFVQMLKSMSPESLYKIFSTRSLTDIITAYSIEEILTIVVECAKSMSIDPGDEVELDDGTFCMILNMFGEEVGYRCLTLSGQTRIVPPSAIIRKTSTHFSQLEEILNTLREDSDQCGGSVYDH